MAPSWHVSQNRPKARNYDQLSVAVKADEAVDWPSQADDIGLLGLDLGKGVEDQNPPL